MDGEKPSVGIIMGSASDWEVMHHCAETLQKLGIPHEQRVISAHRTPDRLIAYVKGARERGLKVLVTGAGLAAGLPGMVAAMTPLPVLGVPLNAGPLQGIDALFSIVQMPGGVPVATFAIGRAGAVNAAVFAAAMLALADPVIAQALDDFRAAQTAAVPERPDGT